ncbi:hypothetical protein TUM17577_33410 [Enterobacter asburiae]|nr:hypothetical protein TUM17577_33410 [Enterobacter asburiae]
MTCTTWAICRVANHPVLLAILAAVSVVLLAWVLWRLLRIISRRRLNPDE